MRVLDFTPVDAAQLAPPVRTIGAERVYLTPAREIRLSRIELDGTGLHHSSSICFDMPGPQILAVLSGAVEVRPADGAPLTVTSGHALWITDDDPDVIVRAASARAVFYRALVPVAVPASDGVSASASAAATAAE